MSLSNANNRNTIYIDESGVASLKDKGKFFILTGIIANNYEFSLLSEYYFRMKLKYFENEIPLHSFDLFRKPSKEEKLFIEELEKYLETLSFGMITIIVDKKKIIKNTNITSPKNPYNVNFSKAKSLWLENKLNTSQKFLDLSIREILNVVKNTEFPNINNYYPLEISYHTLLKTYLNEYAPKMKLQTSEFEICFETSPNREKIIRYTEEMFEERRTNNLKLKTKFAEELKENIYGISFPNKKAQYLGLELADIISYGFNLSKKGKLKEYPYYAKIWSVIKNKEISYKKIHNLESVYNLPN
jgi:hypothetical protein